MTPEEMIALYTDAEAKVLQGQSVTFRGRALTRANLAEIRAGRKEWEEKRNSAAAKSRGGSSLYSVASFCE